MMDMINDNVVCVDLWQIIAHFGYDNQKEKAIEELGELQIQLSRDLQGVKDRDAITEEMADCYIMLAQLQLIYGNHDDVLHGTRMKLARTLDRVEAERTGKEAEG